MFNKNHPYRLFLVLLMLLPGFAGAQLFSHRFGGTPEYDWGHSAQFDLSNGLLVTAGESYVASPMNQDASVVQKDACFNVVNAAVYGSSNSANEVFNSIRPYQNPLLGGSGYVAVGYTDRTGPKDMYLMVLRPNLSVFRAFRFSGGAGDDFATSVVKTSDGGFAFCGRTWNGVDFDMAVIKFDANINFQWSRSIGDVGGDERAFSIIENVAGNLIVAGGTQAYSATGTEEVYIVELDFAGNLVFTGFNPHAFIISTTLEEHATDIGQNPATKDYYITGQQYNGSDFDVILIQFNPSSGLLTQYGYDAGRDEIGSSIEWDFLANEFKVVGRTNSITFGSLDGMWLSLRTTGAVNVGSSWHYGGVEADLFEEIDQAYFPGGFQYFVGGLTKSFTPAVLPNANYYWIYTDVGGKTGCFENNYSPNIRQYGPSLNAKGRVRVWRSPITLPDKPKYHNATSITLCTATCKKAGEGIAQEGIDAKIDVYPNPADNQLFIQSDASEGLASVRILDLQGKEVRTAPVFAGQGKAEMQVSDLPAGIYFAEVALVNGQVKRLKWVKN